MTFISYAQNFEDVMLRRALGKIVNGFYVDIGAQHPVVDSVTKVFYEQGWSGINVEPVPHWYEAICEDRPRDVNLNVAVGNQSGTLQLFSVEETGLSTADPEYAARYEREGRKVNSLSVPLLTLNEILHAHAPENIHFLKVDVEGLEKQVLEGLDLKRFRPWILVIEATLPNSTEERYLDWEPLIVESGYRFAYFDGLNRFYVADERSGLQAAFRSPPNCFDSYVRLTEWEARKAADERGHLAHHFSTLARDLAERADEARQRADCSEARFEQEWKRLERDLHWSQAQLARVETELQTLSRSFSWRITVPLRVVSRGARWVMRRLASALRLTFRFGSRVPVIGSRLIKLRNTLDRIRSARRTNSVKRKAGVSASAQAFISLYERLIEKRRSERQRGAS